MTETRQDRYKREKAAAAYREFIDWAVREIANEVIRSGFTNLRGAIERVLQQYEHYKKEKPP
jgi:hypothetical protein